MNENVKSPSLRLKRKKRPTALNFGYSKQLFDGQHLAQCLEKPSLGFANNNILFSKQYKMYLIEIFP